MKRVVVPILGSIVFVALCAFTLTPADSPQYVGAKSCKGCHNTDKGGKVYAKWESSAHASAFKTLQTPAADKIAADKGFKTKAAETPECLSCHVTGMMEKAAKFDAKFDKAEGVGCESCHGAASLFKTKHNKPEQLEEAKKLGLELPKVADGSAEKHCKQCHNEKSPTYKAFKMKEMWAKIEHGLPK